MTSYDLTPLLKSSVGFDVFDNIFDSVFNLNESSTHIHHIILLNLKIIIL